MRNRPAVFLDRDGVINDLIDRGDIEVAGKQARHTAPWKFEEFSLKPGALEALAQLRAAGFLTIVVTNQPDIAYGLLPLAEHERIMSFLKTLPLDDIYFCPHGRDEGCTCRKPKPGMLLEAAKKWDVNLARSWMVGDNLTDLEAGRAAGCKTIFILPNGESTAGSLADQTAKNLEEAARTITV